MSPKNGYPIRIEILATIQIEWTGIVFAMNLSLPKSVFFNNLLQTKLKSYHDFGETLSFYSSLTNIISSKPSIFNEKFLFEHCT